MSDPPTFILDSESLNSKFGFGDGDLFWDFLWDNGLGEVDNHRVLTEAVRRHLLPLLPEDVEVYEIGTIHNPIRTDCDAPSGVSVAVTGEQVLAIASELARGTSP